MELAKSYCISLLGLAGTLVEVEADISSNLPGFVLVGLPDASLSEASARVRAACANSKLQLPARKITVNLSPAAVPKYGSSFDLAIAVAILAAAKVIADPAIEHTVYLGELGLDGSVRPINGVLPAVMAAKNLGFKSVVVPSENYAEAKLINDISVFSADHLTQVAAMHGSSVERISVSDRESRDSISESPSSLDIAEIHGQDAAVEAMLVAAAGGHHLLLVGPPGVGKTMMAERFTTLLPDLNLEQSLETTAIHSVSRIRGRIGSELIIRPPFEAPHHSASASSLVGGGLGLPSPGLISMAHNGVLFLDEAPEFQSPALESLRQALESGSINIARSSGVARFPSRFQLIMAANPCPCGHAMSTNRHCTCAAAARTRYINRLSGPLLDRVDIRLQINAVNAAQIKISRANPSRLDSKTARSKVTEARESLAQRLKKYGYRLISEVPSSQLRDMVGDGKALRLLETALARGAVSMRGFDRCLRIALSVSALDGRDQISEADIARSFVLRGSDNPALVA